ncbi:hypothetical protein QET93_011495 [Akkermansia sp. N21116]|uniref:hypothetical protein n=1 Tax=Akkermansia sp. N21116 TaxID=3040764 RepID=UPI00244E5F36|nr:hypothetical protein [Akkermansia sp. N21116]WPX40157.1 hypothetical protein QET93_011495 [Akkermansia sp. N21116]
MSDEIIQNIQSEKTPEEKERLNIQKVSIFLKGMQKKDSDYKNIIRAVKRNIKDVVRKEDKKE